MPRKRKPELPPLKERVAELCWTAAQLGGLVFFAWLNASKFDKTELAMLGEFAIYFKLLKTLQGYTS